LLPDVGNALLSFPKCFKPLTQAFEGNPT